ncbi:hypothetical protein [Paraburkholderia phenazinium]|uniref:hypothetical protein n=1 Tax=Paraburkholderia phenazinium TaxID=60549 RepID=UPI00158C63B5|nr:hypothetical protein [Paraburkholderia phenazinium]
MKLPSFVQRVLQRRLKPALTPEGIAFGYGIEKLEIVPGAARRLAALQARVAVPSKAEPATRIEKLSATQLARKYNVSTASIQKKLVELGYIEVRSGLHFFTELGRSVGGEFRKNHADASDSDGHMVWPFDVPLVDAIQSISK